jgi:hypothetical protein
MGVVAADGNGNCRHSIVQLRLQAMRHEVDQVVVG